MRQGQKPEIAAGVEELMSNAWRFEADAPLRLLERCDSGVEVHFQANRGVLEQFNLRRPDQSAGVLLEREKSDFQREIKLREVASWKDLFAEFGAGSRVKEGDDMPWMLWPGESRVYFPDSWLMILLGCLGRRIGRLRDWELASRYGRGASLYCKINIFLALWAKGL